MFSLVVAGVLDGIKYFYEALSRGTGRNERGYNGGRRMIAVAINSRRYKSFLGTRMGEWHGHTAIMPSIASVAAIVCESWEIRMPDREADIPSRC